MGWSENFFQSFHWRGPLNEDWLKLTPTFVWHPGFTNCFWLIWSARGASHHPDLMDGQLPDTAVTHHLYFFSTKIVRRDIAQLALLYLKQSKLRYVSAHYFYYIYPFSWEVFACLVFAAIIVARNFLEYFLFFFGYTGLRKITWILILFNILSEIFRCPSLEINDMCSLNRDSGSIPVEVVTFTLVISPQSKFHTSEFESDSA